MDAQRIPSCFLLKTRDFGSAATIKPGRSLFRLPNELSISQNPKEVFFYQNG
ncbi:hypothetical protein MA16_Dca009083 [Dendrobium catenatum]|uniref:Uncharacterized protein n=1 Tax=Dendrobium catenatum TaxID=906689 RepID=A0A2I0VRH3_9ASPA|nr:hypothetical protein MA16_Dca009083 [Dendrobium catenatum]